MASERALSLCINCQEPVGTKGAKGRCPLCASYWRAHQTERPEGYTNPRYHPCPWTPKQLYRLYWTEQHGWNYIARLVDPPVAPKVVARWLHDANIPTRRVAEAARITAKRYGPANAESMRVKLAEARLRGLITSDASQLHTPEVRAKVIAANKARAKSLSKVRSQGVVSRTYLEILQTLTDKQRERLLAGKSGFNRLRAMRRL